MCIRFLTNMCYMWGSLVKTLLAKNMGLGTLEYSCYIGHSSGRSTARPSHRVTGADEQARAPPILLSAGRPGDAPHAASSAPLCADLHLKIMETGWSS